MTNIQSVENTPARFSHTPTVYDGLGLSIINAIYIEADASLVRMLVFFSKSRASRTNLHSSS